MHYKYRRRKSGLGLFLVLLVLFAIGIVQIESCSKFIDHNEARERFAQLAGVEVGEVWIARHSNATWLVGDPHDVTYELLVAGEPMSGRCFARAFSEMVCRLYGGGGEQ